MAAVTREALMLYCREDDPDMGNLLESLADAAEEYLGGAGIGRTAQNLKRYDLAVMAMALYWRDNPGGANFPEGTQNLINQLKLPTERTILYGKS